MRTQDHRNHRYIPGSGFSFTICDFIFLLFVLTKLPQRIFTSTQNFVLAALPFFIAAAAGSLIGRAIFRSLSKTRGEDGAKKIDTVFTIIGTVLAFVLFGIFIKNFDSFLNVM